MRASVRPGGEVSAPVQFSGPALVAARFITAICCVFAMTGSADAHGVLLRERAAEIGRSASRISGDGTWRPGVAAPVGTALVRYQEDDASDWAWESDWGWESDPAWDWEWESSEADWSWQSEWDSEPAWGWEWAADWSWEADCCWDPAWDAGDWSGESDWASESDAGGSGGWEAEWTGEPKSTGGRLRVMTWNIAFGQDPWGQADVIASSGADVVLLQEASRFEEDMPTTYPERLRQLTGETWQSVWAPHYGRYSENEGTLILTRLPVVDRSVRRIYDRGFSRVLVDIGGVHVNVLNAHLDWYDSGMRSAQLEDFMWWGRQFSGPRIAGGDFNAWWGEWWIRRMTEEHTDTWADVQGTFEGGFTCCPGGVRFDYLFRAFTDNWRITPTGVWTPWSSASDHLPVVADYSVW